MLGPPVDAVYVWVALGIVSLAFVGLALGAPSAPTADAAAVADTVDAVAAAPHPTTARHPLTAAEVRLGPHRLAFRTDAGVVHATLRYGPVTPAGGERLDRVLRGAPPGEVFETRVAFRRALERARNATPVWAPAGDRLLVRSVSWGEVDATLVGA